MSNAHRILFKLQSFRATITIFVLYRIILNLIELNTHLHEGDLLLRTSPDFLGLAQELLFFSFSLHDTWRTSSSSNEKNEEIIQMHNWRILLQFPLQKLCIKNNL